MIHVALVGCGNIGEKRAREVYAHPDSNLVLVIDTDESKAKALALQYQWEFQTDWAAILDDGIDAVIVATPTKYAYEIARGALHSGKHVLCEKPLGINLQQAGELTRIARENGLLLETGLNLRYDVGLLKAREFWIQGMLGELYFLRCDYVNGTALTNTNEVGSLFDLGIHGIDLLLWFLGDVDYVYGDLQAREFKPDDNGFVIMGRAQVQGFLHCSFVRWRNTFRFEASGSRGYVVVDSLPKWGRQVLVYGERQYPAGVPKEQQFIFEKDMSWRNQWDHFIQCLASDKESWDLERGYRAMEFCTIVQESARIRAPIVLKAGKD